MACSAAQEEPVYNIDIPSMNMAEALNRFAEQTGTIMLFSYDLASARRANAVRGQYTLLEGLDLLLRDTGLSGGLSDKRVLNISPSGETQRPGGDAMQKAKISWVNRVAILFGSIFAVPAAWSQDTKGPAVPQPDIVDEIIVTAQKVSESIQDTPISMVAVTGRQIAEQHIYDPSQLTLLAPTLQMQSFNASVGAQVYTVRGVGTLSFGANIEQSVATVIDDVAMGRPEFGFMNFSDVRQVEVLNGPQGTLFGKNASAGLVSIHTEDPVLDSFEGNLRTEFGQMTTADDGDLKQVQGMLNMPLGDRSALRITGFLNDQDPLIKNVFSLAGSDYGQRQSGVRAKYLLQPNDNLRVIIGADYANSKGVGPGATTDRSLAPGSGFEALNAPLGIVAGPDNTLISSEGATNNEFDVGGAQVNVEYEFSGGYTLTNIAAYRFYDNDNIFDVDDHQIDIFSMNDGSQRYRQLSNELRVASPKGERVEYQAGLYFYDAQFDGDGELRGLLGGPPPPPPFISTLGITMSSEEDVKSYAVFGQATVHVGDSARLIFGGRGTYDDLRLQQHSDQDGNIISLGLPGVNDSDQSETQSNFSWRVIGQYDFNPDVMGYVSVAEGYKGPGFNVAFAVGQPVVRPEYPTSYEAGIKSALFDKRLTLNVSTYYTTFEDFQAQSYDAANQSYLLTNAGELKTRGAEALITAVPIKNLTLSAGVSYVDANFASFTGDQCYVGQPADTCFIQPGSTAPTSDSSGNRLPNSPEWTANLSVSYRHAVSDSLELFGSVAGYTRTKVNFSSNADPSTKHAGYSLMNAEFGFGSESGLWSVAAYCRNCFDERFASYIQANPVSPLDYGQQFGVNSFRTVGLMANLHFD